MLSILQLENELSAWAATCSSPSVRGVQPSHLGLQNHLENRRIPQCASEVLPKNSAENFIWYRVFARMKFLQDNLSWLPEINRTFAISSGQFLMNHQLKLASQVFCRKEALHVDGKMRKCLTQVCADVRAAGIRSPDSPQGDNPGQQLYHARAEQLGELGFPGCDEALSGVGGTSLTNEVPGVM